MDRGRRIEDGVYRAGKSVGERLSRELQCRPQRRAAERRNLLLGREAQIAIERRRRHFNAVRPHALLGYKPPAPVVFVISPVSLD